MALNENSLGKSLANVFEKTQKRDSSSKGSVEVDINLIVPSPDNPRKVIDMQHLDELVQSVLQHGIIQPLVVIRRDGGYEIIAGERRYRAAIKAGLQKVPVVIHDDVSSEQLAEIRLIENIQREDLNPIELAQAYKSLIDAHRLSQEQVADKVGKDRSSVANSVRLLTLVDKVQSFVAQGQLSAGHAKALLSVKDTAVQESLALRTISEGLSVREIERLVKQQGEAPASSTGSSRTAKPAHIRELEGNLRRLFGAGVQIRERDGRGALTIQFESKGAFKQIVDILDAAFKQAQQDATKT